MPPSLCAAKLKEWFTARAKARQVAAVKAGNVNRHGNAPVPTNWLELANEETGEARLLAARAVGVGYGTVQRAELVLRDALQELAGC